MFQFNFASQPFSSRSQVPVTLARFLRCRYETLRLAFQALDVRGLGYLTRDAFTTGLERLGYPYSSDAQRLFESMATGHGDRLPMEVFVSYLQKQLGESEGPTLNLTSPSQKDRGTCSVASNCSTTFTGGATPDCSSSQAGAAISEEVTLELENLKVHFGRHMAAMEDEFRSRLGRLEDHVDAAVEECRDECKDEVQRVQAGLLAVAEKAANLAAESKRECDRVGARTKWCSVPLVEAMLSEKLDEVSCRWQAALRELQAVSEERWWGCQAQNAGLSKKLEEILSQCKLSLSEPSIAKLENDVLHASHKVDTENEIHLGSILNRGDALHMTVNMSDAPESTASSRSSRATLNRGDAVHMTGAPESTWSSRTTFRTLSRVISYDAEEVHSQIDLEGLRDSLPPASSKSLPGAR